MHLWMMVPNMTLKAVSTLSGTGLVHKIKSLCLPGRCEVVHAGKNLQAQYERWQPRAKYKMHLDPTMDDVKKLAVSSRRAAKVLHSVLSFCLLQDPNSTHTYHGPGSCTCCFVASVHARHRHICVLYTLMACWVCASASPLCLVHLQADALIC